MICYRALHTSKRAFSGVCSSIPFSKEVSLDSMLQLNDRAILRQCRLRNPPLGMPEEFSVALYKTLKKHPKDGNMHEKIRTMAHYLWHRKLPPTDNYVRSLAADMEAEELLKLQEEFQMKMPDYELTDEDIARESGAIQARIKAALRESVYHWQEIEYETEQQCLVYALTRSGLEYGVLRKIFQEIRDRDPRFTAEHVLDMGSGIGTGFWSVRDCWPSLKEYVGIDRSKAMSELSRTLISTGEENANLLKGVYFRHKLPSSHDRKYSLVLSAYSLMEFPDYYSRMHALVKLWEKTDNYLVIVENGTFAGFQAVLEARDFILCSGREYALQKSRDIVDEIGMDLPTKSEFQEAGKAMQLPTLLPKGYVFAPCPHDFACPRVFRPEKHACYFECSYVDPLSKNPSNDVQKTKYSYVVLKKGERPEDIPQWPRLVLPPLVKSQHVWCTMCTSAGRLERTCLASKRKSAPLEWKKLYKCTKQLRHGDLMPVRVVPGQKPLLPGVVGSLETQLADSQSRETDTLIDQSRKSLTSDRSEEAKYAAASIPEGVRVDRIERKPSNEADHDNEDLPGA